MFENEDAKAYCKMAEAIRKQNREVCHGITATPGAVAILTTGKLQRDLIRRVTSEVCKSIDALRGTSEPGDVNLTSAQAEAIRDMEAVGLREGFGPGSDDARDAWGDLVRLAGGR